MHDLSCIRRERRRFPRRMLEVPSKITFEDGSSQNGVLKDLSVSGSRISNLVNLHKIQAKTTSATLDLSIPQLSVKSRIRGHIAWIHGDQAGFTFEQDQQKPDAKLTSFILDQPNNIKAFSFKVTVYLKDTNAFGNTYFARYFDWQGMAREAFMKAVVQDPMMLIKSGVRLITVFAHTEYHHETVLYDTIVIKAHGENIKHVSFELVFNYFDKETSRVIAVGRQQITFASPTGHIIAVPEAILTPLLQYSPSCN